MQRRRGFSLVEMLVAVAIMATLATVAFPLVELTQRRAKEEQLRQALREIRSALDNYKHLSDVGNIARGSGASGYPPTLGALVNGVPNAQTPMAAKFYLLRRIPRDPLAEPSAKAEDSWGLRSYESAMDDPREGKDVFDVYSKAKGKGLNGVLYRDW